MRAVAACEGEGRMEGSEAGSKHILVSATLVANHLHSSFLAFTQCYCESSDLHSITVALQRHESSSDECAKSSQIFRMKAAVWVKMDSIKIANLLLSFPSHLDALLGVERLVCRHEDQQLYDEFTRAFF